MPPTWHNAAIRFQRRDDDTHGRSDGRLRPHYSILETRSDGSGEE